MLIEVEFGTDTELLSARWLTVIRIRGCVHELEADSEEIYGNGGRDLDHHLDPGPFVGRTGVIFRDSCEVTNDSPGRC